MANSKKRILSDDGSDQLVWDDKKELPPFEMQLSPKIQLTDIHKRDGDRENVVCHVRAIMEVPIALEFTLFEGNRGMYGRFRGRAKKYDGKSFYWQDAPLVDPATGKISFTYTSSVERFIAKALSELFVGPPENVEESTEESKANAESAIESAAAAVNSSEEESTKSEEETAKDDSPPWDSSEPATTSEDSETEQVSDDLPF